MQVGTLALRRTHTRGAIALLAVVITAALSFGAFPANAHAVTRSQVVDRSMHWVKKKVKYSQRGYYQGYRRDCSGFVSMAWKLKKSYTTRTIKQVAVKVPKSKLKPGDAVLVPGHVSIFGGWANRSHTKFWALEETQPGSHAKKRVRPWRRGAQGLRYKGIKNPAPRPVPAPAAAPTPATVPTPTPDPAAVPASSASGAVTAGVLI